MTSEGGGKLVFEPSLQTPFLLPQALAPGVYKHTPIWISKTDEKLLTFLFRTNTVVSSLIERIKSLVFKMGITIQMFSKAKQYILDPSGSAAMKDWWELEIVPAMEKMFEEWLLYGFTSVAVVPSRYEPRMWTIHVYPREFVKQSITYDDYMRPTYQVFANDPGTSQSTTYMSKPLPDSHVFVLYPPSTYGNLTSPIARASKTIAYAEKLHFYYMSGAYRNVFMPNIWSSSDGTSSRMATAGPENTVDSALTVNPVNGATAAGVGYVGLSDAKNNMDIANQELITALETENYIRVKEARKAMMGPDDTLTSLVPDEVRRIEAFDPVVNQHVGLPGRKLERPQEVKLPSDYLEFQRDSREEIYNVLELPPAMGQAVSDNSASVEAIDRSLRDTVQRNQKRTQPIYEKLMTMVMIKSAVERVYSEEIDKDDKLSKDVKAMSEIRRHLRIELQFNHVPSMTFQAATEYYEAGIITPEAYQVMSLQIGGIPLSAKRPNMEKWRDEQWEKQNPPKNPGEVPKKPKKPKKKSSKNKKK